MGKKQMKGITLIALVITIIVLIILAGVTIATLSGPNGILTQANEAKKRTEQGNKEEQARLADMEDLINNQGKGTFNSKQGVNQPKLSQGMIPIKYENGKWVVTSETDEQWYQYINQTSGTYGSSKWANVMLSDGTYKAGDVTVGQVVEEDELGSMFVWIPRYAYYIENLYHTSSNSGGKISVEFLVGRSNVSAEGRKSFANQSGEENWNIHPAFTFGNQELTGIWVAKFEASSTTTTPDTNYGGGNVTNLQVKVLPGKQSWTMIQINNCFTNCINMNNETNAPYYGISSDDNTIDPHLMKNNEWGAVAYLTQSSYGRNGEQVTPNSNGYNSGKYIYTGYAGEGTTAGNPWEGTTAPTNVYYYNTPEGVKASTTKNETGIYDLSGGSWEYVAAYVENSDGNLNSNGEDLYDEADSRYKAIYKSGEAEETTEDQRSEASYQKANTIFGDAIWETSNGGTSDKSWFSGRSVFPRGSRPFFLRGGRYDTYGGAGLYCFAHYSGGDHASYSFRPVLSVF